MLFATPPIGASLQERLNELDKLRGALGHETSVFSPWMGTLRRQVRTSSVESSTAIEGYRVPAGEAIALVEGDHPVDPEDENRMAVFCYARAMDHVGVMAVDSTFNWLDRVVLDLHFDACWFQRDKAPGRWRSGSVGVTGSDGHPIYRAPEVGEVPGLMAEAVDWLRHGDLDAHVVVRAAMAHLHVVSVHPFRDGNGRVARIVQSLVLAREGMMSPEFGSIEEYLGAHTADYYAALHTLGGSYEPKRDASTWVAFCVEAHLAQARQRLAQIEKAAGRWTKFERLVASRGWPDRFIIALEQAAMGGTDRRSYASEADVSAATATADLRRLLDAGLVEKRGRGRGVRYLAGDALRAEAT